MQKESDYLYVKREAYEMMQRKLDDSHDYAAEAERAAREFKLNWSQLDFTKDDLAQGIRVEYEHGTRDSLTNVTNDDEIMTAKIALAHLMERGDYYDGLKMLEDAPYGAFRTGAGIAAFASARWPIAVYIAIIIVIIAVIIIVYYAVLKNESFQSWRVRAL